VIDKKKPPKVDLEYFADEVKQFGRFIFLKIFRRRLLPSTLIMLLSSFWFLWQPHGALKMEK